MSQSLAVVVAFVGCASENFGDVVLVYLPVVIVSSVVCSARFSVTFAVVVVSWCSFSLGRLVCLIFILVFSKTD